MGVCTRVSLIWAIALCFALASPNSPAWSQIDSELTPKSATAATRASLERFTASLPVADRDDFDLVNRGFIAGVPGNRIVDANGKVLRHLDVSAFFSQAAPSTVNPSLWRNAGLVAKSGLFKLSDRIYQIRGLDYANMTVVLGNTGFIVVDTLMITEAAKAGLDLLRQHVGDRPVVGIIYTHSHPDHYGGVKGIIDEQNATSRRVPILAPRGFMNAIVAENVIALPAWGRRGAYQFGLGLPFNATGFITSGDGPTYSSRNGGPIATAGTLSLIPPTREIASTGDTVTIDGVRIEFQVTPGTEAPSEMNIYFPDLRALCMAENVGGTLHNILPLRGAEVRDAKAWADDLTEALRLYGSRTDILFTGHFWPRWGTEKIVDYISAHRDALKYEHDQTVRLMNNGLTGAEIAEQLELPEPLAKRWFNRGNYGTLTHNAKAIYQRYLGWYDGNPANLNPLPPEEAAKRYVEAMGGEASVLSKSKAAFDKGDYRWAAELLSNLVFAAPDKTHSVARTLLADTLEQLRYQAESGSWRNVYLSGAQELRKGSANPGIFDASGQTFRNLPLGYMLDLLAVRLVPNRALKDPMRFNLVLIDENDAQSIEVRNGVLIHEKGDGGSIDASRTLRVDRASFIAAVLNRSTSTTLSNDDAALLNRFSTLFEAPRTGFGLVTSRPRGWPDDRSSRAPR